MSFSGRDELMMGSKPPVSLELQTPASFKGNIKLQRNLQVVGAPPQP
jgi:hypothetical protein